ncbi:DNA/RNA polymerases superfamily protein [Gossypium australe]|uniref:DNA/RNA polymerases superfamily protein n=1 Tax=Gossypium australe TaxID=47621 RepID=A0A5B6VAG7_9ROSI|nr:DNA/RNA polymerases superfamily protein [Gossypium australe]
MPVASVGNVRSNKPECGLCGKGHFGECRLNDKACFRCGSHEYFIRDCPELDEKDKSQSARQSNTTTRGRPFHNVGNVSGGRGATRDTAARSEVRAPARTYAIRTREEASSPDVITVSSKNLLVDSTQFVIKVSNPLGKYVLVDKVFKNCPLMTRGYCFMADLMLLPFDEFDVILGMDWLMLHDTVVNCRRKTIELKCQNNETLRIESNDLKGLPAVI